jgi:guanosine-3',5'-bis(diphosphate) 3'-pyrophosphohydrolase
MTVKDIIKSNPQGLIARAYRFAEKAHAGKKRKTGDPYFSHVLATADILASWHLDEASIAAGLLHDTVEDTPVTMDELKKEFGEDIAFLVDGVTKLGRIKYRGAQETKSRAEEKKTPDTDLDPSAADLAKVENLRKMIFAISEDLRVVFIKLADRLHNMRTLGALPPQKQKRIALETDEIYAPIAYRLGMQNLAGELRDLAFPYLHPKEYEWLKKTMREEYSDREQYLRRIKPILEKTLRLNGIQPLTIDFRAKRMSSLYYKLLRHEMDIGRIYDLVAMRVIVNTVSECYAVLGVIHHIWPPLPGRIKDYIAMPKPNGYRSLHTTVIGPEEKIVEIQIRTKQMHEENEHGIAAHWLYEQKKTGQVDKGFFQKIKEELRWVKQLREWQSRYADVNSEDFIQAMKIDFFKDRIFVITPRGDVIDLPVGATPVDFAYHIHTEIGNSCVGAKVNGAFVPLNHQLRSGDMVEILTQKNKLPSEDWLKFVKTSIARDHIRAALRAKNKRLRAEAAPSRVELRLTVQNRIGLLKDISGIIAQSHFNILSVNTIEHASGKFPILKIQCAMADAKKVEKLLLKLKRLKEVREISYQLV